MRQRGFTLLEIIIALGIFSVGMLSVITIASQSQSLTALTMARTRGALLAQEGIEMTEATSYDNLLTSAPFLNDASLSALGSDFAPYSRTVTVQYVDGNLNISQTDHGMKLITATVNWTSAAHDVSKLPKTFSLTTIRTNM